MSRFLPTDLDEAVRSPAEPLGLRGRAATGWAGLTGAEVTALVTEALSHPEITARLGGPWHGRPVPASIRKCAFLPEIPLISA